MNLRLKTFGLALIALIALAAMSAPVASAAPQHFNSDKENTVLTGEDDAAEETALHVPGTGTTICNNKAYTGTQAGASAASVRITPIYSGCTTSNAHTIIDMNNCEYDFTLHTGTTATGGGATHFHGPVHVVCPAGNEITLTVTAFGFNVCTIHVPPQTPTTPTVDYKNVANHIEVTITVKGITTVSTNTGGGCANGVHHNGEFTGKVTVRGYEDTGGTQTAPKHNSNQVAIRVT